MAEIKLNEGFTKQVESFRTAGENVDSVNVYSGSVSGLSLPTVDAYQDRLFRIQRIMILFRCLVKKDADDMDALSARLKAADTV